MIMIIYRLLLLLMLIYCINCNKCNSEQCDNNDALSSPSSIETRNYINGYYQNPVIKIPVNDINILTINLPIVDQVSSSSFVIIIIIVHHHSSIIIIIIIIVRRSSLIIIIIIIDVGLLPTSWFR